MRKSLKICLIGSAQSIHIQRWASFLVSRGHQVHILSNFPDQISEARVWPLHSKKRLGNLSYVLSIWKVYRLLKMLKPDIVHFHYLGGSSLYSLILNLLDLPAVVATPWGSDIYGKQTLRKVFLRRLLKRADKVITTSEAMSNVIRESFGIDSAKLVTHSWGVDLALFRPVSRESKLTLRAELDIPKSAFVIFSNRTMAPLYRIELVIRAFLKAREMAQGLFLVVLEGPVGDQRRMEYRERVGKLVKDAGGTIRLLKGLISPEMMSKYLAISDAVVSIPSSDQRSTSVLEALASCPIVILSNIPPYTELQEEGYKVMILPQVTEESLKEILLSAQALPLSTREQWLQSNYQLIVQRESWEAQAVKMEQEYYRLLQGDCEAKPALLDR